MTFHDDGGGAGGAAGVDDALATFVDEGNAVSFNGGGSPTVVMPQVNNRHTQLNRARS